MLDVVRYWLDLGVDGYRADAVPYLYEREGTSCENLPETHAFLKSLRGMMNAEYPGRVLLCEANMWPEDVREYFGDGDEFHLGFHFPIMPRIFMAIKKGDAADMIDILDRTPEIPEACQWVTFLRNHDELTLEMVTVEEREWMWAQYAPEARMRLNLGIRRRLAPLLDNDPRVIRLAHALLFSLPGSPIVYYGDEIGMGDNIWLDDRNGVRTPMQWRDAPHGGFTEPAARPYSPAIDSAEYGYAKASVEAAETDPDSLLHFIRGLIATRKKLPALGAGDFAWVRIGNPGVAAFRRTLDGQAILCLNNLRDAVAQVSLKWDSSEPQVFWGAAGRLTVEPGRLEVELEPYGFAWLKI
jgi:maltose alpha-D-glucosyltransferase/alpha-amylase